MCDGLCGVELAREAMDFAPSMGVLYTSGYTERALNPRDRLPQESLLLKKPFTMADLAGGVRVVIEA